MLARIDKQFNRRLMPIHFASRNAGMINNRFGFSLMELMVTIAVIGVLAAIAIPNALSWRTNSQFNAGIREVKSAIENTRMAAIKTNMATNVTFNGTRTFQTQTRSIIAGAAVLNPPVNHQLPTGVTANANNGGVLTFNNRGMANLGGTVTVQHTNGSNRQVVVAVTGTSRIQ